MVKTKTAIEKRMIPTYEEPDYEELPMFAENRVHQRTSGNPYPNKVVVKVNREKRILKEYTVVTLENKYLKIEILPEIGGRIYSALDKTTGYDFFYKQSVIKPALIGALGSWVSGGVEFNWPFHHRTSSFMPCDYDVKEYGDGTAVCYLSEHDPIDRMKGMVSILLRPEERIFETRMQLFNRTCVPKSFLWWENAAVPVHEGYQIFFPQDVSYVNFHYLKSRTSYPVAGNCIYNGIPMEECRDISWHKNTRHATSYFACASNFDFFGGYDHTKDCGVVHIGDHHITPGKKMFTWGYGELSKAWENALTDTDGQYAELMAGSFSDNQPDFSWIEPYETKEFSQYWYPISRIGTPSFANENVAFRIDRIGNVLTIQSTREYKDVEITIEDQNKTAYQDITIYQDEIVNQDKIVYQKKTTLLPDRDVSMEGVPFPEFAHIEVKSCGKVIASYCEQKWDEYHMPEVITDMPPAVSLNSAQELYLAGVHVRQYRDPAVMPDAYWKEALNRDIHHIPSLIEMAKYEYSMYRYDRAKKYITRAIQSLTCFNKRLKSGEAYYVHAQILEAEGEYEKAYDSYYQSSWAADCVNKAMTRISMLDIRRQEYEKAIGHASTAMSHDAGNFMAAAVIIIAKKELAMDYRAEIEAVLGKDPLNHLVRYLSEPAEFYGKLDSNPLETCIDIVFDLDTMGLYQTITELLSGLISFREDMRQPMAYYLLGYYKFQCGKDGLPEYQLAKEAGIGRTFPVRAKEMLVLQNVIRKAEDEKAKMLLGCLLYNKRHYEEATELFSQCSDWISVRNLAVSYFSHLNRKDESLSLMKKALKLKPESDELVFETAVLMDKLQVSPTEKAAFLLEHKVARDDWYIELAKAYNQSFMPEEALKLLVNHRFVPCEGGEHAVADQYLFAHLLIGRNLLAQGKYVEARNILQTGQILPQSLGIGIWNQCKLVPLKYFEALCLNKMGSITESNELFQYIADIGIDYFSNMHLKELPYFQACANRQLGRENVGKQIITKCFREWEKIEEVTDNGYFNTTPFFIPFMDQPKELRHAQYCYLNALCLHYSGQEEEAIRLMEKSVRMNNDNLLAISFLHQGF